MGELRRQLKEAAAAGKRKDTALRKAQDAAAAQEEKVGSPSPSVHAQLDAPALKRTKL